MESNELIEKLQAPFLPNEIEWRVDRGQKTGQGNYVFVLAYVTNRAIMNRLDEVFGPTGWKNEFREWKQGSQLCGISVKIDGEWVTKWDGSDDSNMDAVKGGLSGAMKRAAVQWGIGRYLYNLDQNRIPLKERGQNYANVKVRVQGKEEYIKGYWDTPTLPEWALPSGYKQEQDSGDEEKILRQMETKWKVLNEHSLDGFIEWVNKMREKGAPLHQLHEMLAKKLVDKNLEDKNKESA
ncbi:Rad52/Rad22 family DNA repair protein [Paenibacillus macerans]|uniref:Rad52/Rad22 family DNA repair protein n=1 Tax=Paenibacillus macerans TaxID=44252 RepID=UPI00203AFA0A|nr:Rad52/Rad22 family DNA repair protein [Paenibacillus macerans]MCM3703772.1 Rad52/Rad22 family DNA repair protein [Paenibacillus macerans]